MCLDFDDTKGKNSYCFFLHVTSISNITVSSHWWYQMSVLYKHSINILYTMEPLVYFFNTDTFSTNYFICFYGCFGATYISQAKNRCYKLAMCRHSETHKRTCNIKNASITTFNSQCSAFLWSPSPLQVTCPASDLGSEGKPLTL